MVEREICRLAEVLTPENYSYLAETAANYASLLGRRLAPGGGASPREEICLLYNRFSKLFPDDQGLNIELNDGKLHWVVFYEHDCDGFTAYWIPVGFIDKLEGRFRDIAVTFIHRLTRHNRLYNVLEGYDWSVLQDYILEILDEWPINDEDDQLARDKAQWTIDQYEGGIVSELFAEIGNCPRPVDLDHELEHYKPKNERETRLLKCFREGRDFLAGDCRLMDCDYYFCNSQITEGIYCDDSVIGLDRMFQLIWRFDDFFTEEMRKFINADVQSGVDTMVPVSHLILKPDTDRIFRVTDYPERFSKWILDTHKIF